MLMRTKRVDLRAGMVIRPVDWLADEHAQRDNEREPAPRFLRKAPPQHTRGARQLSVLGRMIGQTGTDGGE